MTQAQALYRLQEIELKFLRGQKRLAEIAGVLADNQTVSAAQNRVKGAREQLAPLQTKIRDLELEIQSNTEKIRLSEQHLYSGHVRNPKELQDIQKEIQSLKKHTVDLEEALLETMLLVEAAEGQLTAAQAALEQTTADWEAQNRQLLEEQAQLQSEQEKLQQQRQQALSAVTPESLKAYSALKPRKQNQPVAVLSEEACSTCGVEQTMAIIGEVRRGQALVFCLSCGRILVDKKL